MDRYGPALWIAFTNETDKKYEDSYLNSAFHHPFIAVCV